MITEVIKQVRVRGSNRTSAPLWQQLIQVAEYPMQLSHSRPNHTFCGARHFYRAQLLPGPTASQPTKRKESKTPGSDAALNRSPPQLESPFDFMCQVFEATFIDADPATFRNLAATPHTGPLSLFPSKDLIHARASSIHYARGLIGVLNCFGLGLSDGYAQSVLPASHASRIRAVNARFRSAVELKPSRRLMIVVSTYRGRGG